MEQFRHVLQRYRAVRVLENPETPLIRYRLALLPLAKCVDLYASIQGDLPKLFELDFLHAQT